VAKVAIFTLGCKANQYDSEQLKKEFVSRGWKLIDEQADPDVFLVNSCAVTGEAARQSRQRLRKKLQGRHKPFLVLYGCYPQSYPLQAGKTSEIDLITGRMEPAALIDRIEEVSGIKPRPENRGELIPFQGRTRAFLKIEEGCESFCSYCIVPRARGGIWSKPLADIQKEVDELLHSGFKEIVLTGIHLGYYGKDRDQNHSLEKVIREILKTSLPRLRLSSLEINEVSPELLELMAAENALCPHLHLPLQSGSNRVLQMMNRQYSAQEFMEKTTAYRKVVPEVGLTTDIMVGFPGESREDFSRTVEVVRQIGFSRIHVFPFSPRPGTPAARRNDPIPGPEKKRRSLFLREVGEELMKRFNSHFLKRQAEVLVEGSSPVQGWSPNYIRYYLPDQYPPGQLLQVQGEKIFQDGLWGKEVQ